MSNISTFGTFTIARLGIYASHKAIDIVGNNISNINTEGYTRQDIDQFSMNMGGADRYQSLLDTRVGSGAFVAGVTQMRDQFLDIRYRDEQASVGAMEGRVDGLRGIEAVIDEVGRGEDGEGVLEARFNEMIQMMQRLNTEGAGRDEFDSLFRASASALVNTIHSYATQLETQQDIQEMQFRQDVDQFNTILLRIRDLNASIRKTQVYGGNALEQQDERNLLIDELSSYTRIDVTIEKEYLGEKKYVDKLVIKTSDEPQRTLVDGIFAAQLSIDQVDDGKGNLVDDPDMSLSLSALTDVNGRKLITSEKSDEIPLRQAVDTATLADQILADTEKYPATVTKDGVTYDAAYELVKNADGDYDVKQTLKSQGNVVSAKNLTNASIDSYRNSFGELDGLISFLNNPDAANRMNEPYISDFPLTETDAEGNEYQYTYALGDPLQNEKGQYVIAQTRSSVGPVKFADPTYDTLPATSAGDPDSDLTDEEAQALLDDPDIYPASGVDEDGNVVSYTYALKTDEEGNPVKDDDGNYTVIRTATRNGAATLGDIELYGKLQSEREVLTKQGVFSTAEELEKDPNAASKRGIPFYRKALDVLANTLATTLNNANVTDGKEGPLFSNSGISDDTESINASNISISKSWANGSFKVYTSSDRETQSTANDNLNKILNLISSSIHEFKPQGASGELNNDAYSAEVFFTGSFQELFTNHMMGSLANDIKVTNTMLNNYQAVSEEIYVDRDAVHGVDLNDEAMNMMMYQKSYSAACRLMTVYDEMLDRLINGTAM